MKGPNYKPLEKELAITHIAAIEATKVTYMAPILVKKNLGEMSDERVTDAYRMMPVMTMDTYEKEHSVSDQDILIAMNKYELAMSKELQEILFKSQQSLHYTVQTMMRQVEKERAKE